MINLLSAGLALCALVSRDAVMIVGSVLAGMLINLANDDQSGERKGKNEGKGGREESRTRTS